MRVPYAQGRFCPALPRSVQLLCYRGSKQGWMVQKGNPAPVVGKMLPASNPSTQLFTGGAARAATVTSNKASGDKRLAQAFDVREASRCVVKAVTVISGGHVCPYAGQINCTLVCQDLILVSHLFLTRFFVLYFTFWLQKRIHSHQRFCRLLGIQTNCVCVPTSAFVLFS